MLYFVHTFNEDGSARSQVILCVKITFYGFVVMVYNGLCNLMSVMSFNEQSMNHISHVGSGSGTHSSLAHYPQQQTSDLQGERIFQFY